MERTKTDGHFTYPIQAEQRGIGYDRIRDLPKLIALWPDELRDFSRTGTHTIISRLRLAMRAERKRGQSGHWSYDLERHLALVRAYKAERALLAAI